MVSGQTSQRLHLWIISALATFALVTTLTTPVGAQTDTAEAEEAELLEQQSELNDRIEAIENELGELDDAESQAEEQISNLDGEEGEIVGDLAQNHADLEAAADDLEFLALERREPAIIRASIAVERFVSGDPAGEALAQELQAIGGTDSSQDPLQQQEVLASVIEGADGELDRIGGEILEATNTVETIRSGRVELESRRDGIDAERAELANELARIETERAALNGELPTIEEELDVIAEGLAFLQSLASLAELDEDADPDDPDTPVNPATLAILTGRPAEGSPTRAALAVKIDNVPNARPQAGINSADVVYVELVEGGQTRFAAVFQSENVGTIGPVRSMRTTDINLLRPLNSPLFASSGANNGVTDAVNASSLINVSASTGAGSAYFRDSSGGRFAPHNLFSSDSALRSTSSAAGTPPQLFSLRRPGSDNPNNPQPTNGVNVSYGNTSVSYVWNGDGWARSQDGGSTIDASTGARTAPETVIVRFTPYGTSPADASSPEATTVGNGTAWVFTEGQLIVGSWSKANGDAVTRYTDGNGNPVELEPGRVWVELPPPGGASLR